MKNILVPLSLWDTSETVARHSERLAHATESRIHLMHVLAPEAAPPNGRDRHDETRQELRIQANQLSRRGLEVQTHTMAAQDVARAILEHAEVLRADLIVMGTHKPGLVYNAPLGEAVTEVLERAPCLVTIVPTKLVKKERGEL